MNIFSQKRKQKADWPEYVLTDRYPADSGVGEELLGRVVANYHSPLDDYQPSDPRPALRAAEGVPLEPLEIQDSEFSALLSVEKNTKAAIRLGQILNIDFSKLDKQENDVDSNFVRTRMLVQHFESFQALLKKHQEDIVGLTRRAGGVAYMVVGFKSCVNGHVGKSRQSFKGKKIEATAPVGFVSTVGSHGAVNPGNTIDPKIEYTSQTSQSASTNATMVGEQIFAVRYRVLKLQKRAKAFHTKDFGEVLKVEPQHGVYGGDDDTVEELIMGDDISDIDEGDDDTWKYALDNDEEFILGGELVTTNGTSIVDAD